MLSLLAALVLAPLASANAASGITLNATPNPVVPGERVNLVAGMPAGDVGTLTQELVQQIDPTRLQLTSANDIIAPDGWSLTFSTDGTNFTATTPSTSAQWAAVRAVKASGSILSGGSEDGFQVATGTGEGTLASALPSGLVGSTGDGYDAFFDPGHTRVFNIPHHQDRAGATVDCHIILTGAQCVGFPYKLDTTTHNLSQGRIVGTQLWTIGTQQAAGGGQLVFRCVELSAVIASGGSPADCSTPKVVAATGLTGKITWNAPPYNGPRDIDFDLHHSTWFGFAGVEPKGTSSPTRIWSVNSLEGRLVCVDTALAAPCSGMPANGWPLGMGAMASDVYGSQRPTDQSIEVWDGRLYIKTYPVDFTAFPRPVAEYVATCRLASNPSVPCPGWTGSNEYRIVNHGKFVQLPGADGSTRGICLLGLTANCYNAIGGEFGGPASLKHDGYLAANAWGDSFLAALSSPIRQGTRIYFSDGDGGASSWSPALTQIMCWDARLNAGAGGGCMLNNSALSLSGTTATDQTYSNYTITPDPVYQDCIWIGQDPNPTLRTVNARTGQLGCNTLAQSVDFTGSPIVPRMGCSTPATGEAIRYWRSFTLGTPVSGYATAMLTVKDSAGVPIEGWANIAITAGSRVSLRDLPVSVTGQRPTFTVAFTDVTGGVTNATAQVQAVGDAPELCLTPRVLVSCPSFTGPLSDGLLAAATGSSVVIAAGRNSISGGGTVDYPSASATVSTTAPTPAACSALLSGTALEALAGPGLDPRPVAGAVIRLWDSTGNAVMYPMDWPEVALRGQQVTTLTAADGSYTFGNLAAGGYAVSFENVGDYQVYSATSSGTTNLAGGAPTLTSATLTLAAGDSKSITGTYLLPLEARPDTSVGPMNTTQSVNPLANDSPTSLDNWTGATVTLCGPTESAPSCTATSIAIAGVGTYSVTGSGPSAQISFVPEPAFVGSAPTIDYQVKDAGNRITSSTYTPTVFGPVSGTNDAATSGWDSNIVFSVTSNDVIDPGNEFIPGSVRLCGSGQVVPACTATSITVSGEGTYTVNGDGSITFDPLPTFSGTVVNPVTYVVEDRVGQVASAQVIPTILSPEPPSAKPALEPVLPIALGGSGTTTFDPLLAPGAGALAYGAGAPTACLVDPDSGTCGTSVTIPGTGTYVLDPATKIVTFTVAAGVTEAIGLTPVTYRILDSFGQVVESTLTPVIPEPPTVTNDVSSGYQDVNQIISVLLNDTAGSAGALDPSSVRLCASGQVKPACSALVLIVPGEGTYSVDEATGFVTFDPEPSFTGAATPVNYSVQDSVGQRSSGTITPTVLPVPSGSAIPSASTDRKSGPFGQPIELNARGNDRSGSAPASSTVGLVTTMYSDPELDATSVRLCAPGQVLPDCDQLSLTTVDGTYTVDPSTGTVTFMPVDGFTGTVTQPVPYQIRNRYDKIIETQQIGVTELPDGCPGANCEITPVDDVNGREPADPDYIPTWDVTSRTTSPMSFAATALLIPTVLPPTGPVARDDSGTTAPGTPITIAPFDNDLQGAYALRAPSLLLCGPLETAPNCTKTTVSIPGQGTFSVNTATGEVTFVPLAGFTGTATIPYRILDWNGNAASATIRITVPASVPAPTEPGSGNSFEPTAPSPSAPLVVYVIDAVDDLNATRRNTPLIGSAAANDIFPAGSTFSLATNPLHGTVVFDPTGSYSYVPNRGFVGTDSFTYVLCAPGGAPCQTASVTVTVISPGQILTKPVVLRLESSSVKSLTFTPKTAVKPSSVRISPLGSNTWQSRIAVPGKGTWVVRGDKVLFKPRADFVGRTTIKYRVIDSQGRIAVSTFTAASLVVPGVIDAGKVR